MNRVFSHSGLISLGILALFPPLVRAEDPTPRQMMAEIHRLQEKVEKLEARDIAPPAAGIATVPDRNFGATADSIQSDADRHTRLFDLDNPLTGGWDGKQFILRSEDGAFSLHPGLVVDFREMTSYREHIAAKGGGEVAATGFNTQSGFDVSRLRLTLDGTVFKNVTYFLQLSADQGAPLTLLDVYAAYHFENSPFSFKAGQFKDPIWHERNLSESRLMAVDRSLLENLLAGGQGSRVQGVALLYDKNRIRGQAVFHDGFNSQNTKFFDAGGNGAGIGGESGVTPTNFGGSARAEFLAIGNRSGELNPFADYDGGFSSLNTRQTQLVLGGGVDYTQAGSNNLLAHSLDLQFNTPGGLSIYGGYVGTYRALHVNQGVAPGYYYDPGFIAQIAYVFNKKIEPFARYDYIHLSPLTAPGLATRVVQEITVGANYYVYRQNVKLTLDGTYLLNGAPGDSDALGILKDSGKNEFVLRGQFQLSL